MAFNYSKEYFVLSKMGLFPGDKNIILTPKTNTDYTQFAQEVISHLENTVLVVVDVDFGSHDVSSWKNLSFYKKNKISTAIGDTKYDKYVRHSATMPDGDLDVLIDQCAMVILPSCSQASKSYSSFVTKCLLKAKVMLHARSWNNSIPLLTHGNSIEIRDKEFAEWVKSIHEILIHPEDAYDFGFISKCRTKAQLEKSQINQEMSVPDFSQLLPVWHSLNFDQVSTK